jgi:hypothetical protein
VNSNSLLRVTGLAALLATIGPSVFYFTGSLELAAMNRWMLAGTVGWFLVQGLLVCRGKQRG